MNEHSCPVATSVCPTNKINAAHHTFKSSQNPENINLLDYQRAEFSNDHPTTCILHHIIHNSIFRFEMREIITQNYRFSLKSDIKGED